MDIREIKDFRMDEYKDHFSDCIILTHDNKFLLQKRPDHWTKNGGGMNIFGGKVEQGETALQGLKREMQEELGLIMKDENIIYVATITEGWTNHQEAVHIHFFHDKDKTITGCYEGESVEFEKIADILNNPKVMDYTKWAFEKAKAMELVS